MHHIKKFVDTDTIMGTAPIANAVFTPTVYSWSSPSKQGRTKHSEQRTLTVLEEHHKIAIHVLTE